MAAGRRAVLFTITAVTGGLDAAQVAVLDIQTGKHKCSCRQSRPLCARAAGSSTRLRWRSGHLVYATAGTLRAVPFDLTRLETYGTPVPIEQNVVTTATGAVDAVVAGDGTLAYVAGSMVSRRRARSYGWTGRETRRRSRRRRAAMSIRGCHLMARASRCSPPMRSRTSGFDLGRRRSPGSRPVPGVDSFPVWTLDGQRLIFSSQRTSAGNLYWKPADGTGPAERLHRESQHSDATAVSPDGRSLIFTETAAITGGDVMQITLDEPRTVTPLVKSSFSERNGIVSPDGHWLAYESNENSGRFEIFVRPFPEVGSGSLARCPRPAATRPLWARNGQELFYVSRPAP